MMTEIDSHMRAELAQRRAERASLADAENDLRATRQKVNDDTIATIREAHSQGVSDQRIADALGMSRQAVNVLRLHGEMPSNFGRKASGTPALDSAG